MICGATIDAGLDVATAPRMKIDETFARDVAQVGALADFCPGDQRITRQDR